MTVVASPPETFLLDRIFAGEVGRVVFIEGCNFSGRSDVIHALAEKAIAQGSEAIVIPPEITPALSGLAPTVEDELLLHLDSHSHESPYWSLAEAWGLLSLRDRDPQTLSGGQQALLVILCKLARRPRLLALDGTLEQLDPENAAAVLAALHSVIFLPPPCVAVIAHNGSWPGQNHPVSVAATSIPLPDRYSPPPSLDVDGFRPTVIADPATIELRDISFRYPGGPPVFSGLNLTLHPGRIYRLAGANGAGKSTFARILCGIFRLTSGSIVVNGQPFDSYRRPGTLARLHFQNPDAQLFGESVHNELATLPPDSRGPAATFAGIHPFPDTHPFDLPFVLRKRLALTLIFHTDARWLIFDEPSLGLDAASQERISSALYRLAQAGYGVLCISHNQEFERLISPTVIHLSSNS